MAAAELKTLGRYNLERVLGKGAMGVVYEGVDPRLNRRVAIKTILKGHLDDEAASKEYSMRFMREAQSVARLNHPNIVQVYDFGEQGDIAYIVMEFIKGKELKNFFDANERFDLKEAVRIMCELLEALEFAHQAGIVHRDIKPGNVMVDVNGHAKLTDFGVARVAEPANPAEAAAKRYREGQGMERRGDHRGALAAFLEAGEAGHGLAQRKLGQIYDKGNAVVPRDYQVALKWYQKAREQGVEIDKPLQRTTPR